MKALPSLRQLRYLVALADHNHFGRAAAVCFVTQSTLSAGLRELEATLGATLVERTQRQVALTAVGEEVVVRARDLLGAVEELAFAAQSASRPLCGLLRLGVLPTISSYLLPGVLARVRANYPDLRLYLREEKTADLIHLVGSSRLDAAIIALPYATQRLAVARLGSDSLWLACPRGHRFASVGAVAVDDLANEPLLLLEDGHCLRDHVLTACRIAPGQVNEDLQGTSLSTLVQMVASGVGLTLIPRLAVAAELRREPSVAAVPLKTNPARELALVSRPASSRASELGLLVPYLAAGIDAIEPPSAGTGA